MKTKEAIEIVENYNLRLKGDKDIPKINPETITVSLDTVIKIVKNLYLPHVSGSVLSINLHEYGYSCGDGCCYNYGTITTVNKTELPCHNQDAGTILRQVLEHLGYCVEITYSDDIS